MPYISQKGAEDAEGSDRGSSLVFGWSPHSPAPLPDNSAVVGVWTNKIDSRPTIVLNIEEENGKLIG